MKIKTNIITLLTALGFLASCSDDISAPAYTVGEADNAIALRAGVTEGGSGVTTRAVPEYGEHAKHVGFAENTQIALRVDGLWTGHSPEDVKQKTVATLGAITDKHNPLNVYTPSVFWDDYGMADPANASTGREQGLTIYGAAVDGKTSLPTTLSSLDNTTSTWQALTWSVGTPADNVIDQSGTNGWSDYDLLTSNNVVYNASPGPDNAYKFANRNVGKLLEFTHAMTKMTVELTAGAGFPRTTADNPATAHFEAAPTVTLNGFYYTGTVNVEAKTSTPSTGSTANIKMKLSNGGATYKTTFDAMVFPGKDFQNTDEILTLTADGNTFTVTAAKLNAAIDAAITNKATTSYPASVGDHTLKQAWNYKLKITVSKTDLEIEATIVDWNEVEAQEETPKINIDQTYGHDGTAFANNFDFFRSTAKASGYSNDAWVEHTEPISGTHAYTFHDQLYWPNHQIHYFFRGVFPRVQTDSQAGWIPAGNVTTSNISVANAGYSAGTYPSDLAIGWPKTVDGEGNENGDDETCKVHTSPATQGICATEGVIKMNFKYVMSKVQFSLKSTGVEGKDKVDLSNVKVEIINGKNAGKIRFSDGLHENFVVGDKGNYTLSKLVTPETGFSVTTLDAIVPQELDDNVIIRITVTNSDSTTDVYEAQLNKLKDSSSNLINEWKPGNYYKYKLDIKKTAIKVTATITDWVPVEANEDVWF